MRECIGRSRPRLSSAGSCIFSPGGPVTWWTYPLTPFSYMRLTHLPPSIFHPSVGSLPCWSNISHGGEAGSAEWDVDRASGREAGGVGWDRGGKKTRAGRPRAGPEMVEAARRGRIGSRVTDLGARGFRPAARGARHLDLFSPCDISEGGSPRSICECRAAGARSPAG